MKRNTTFLDSSWSLILIMAAGFFLIEMAKLQIRAMLKDVNEQNILLIHALIPTIIIAPFLLSILKYRDRFEKALKESEVRFRTLFEGAPDAIFLADPDTGIIIDANSRASELIGRPHEEIIGMHQAQLHPPRFEEYSRRTFNEHARKTKLMEDIRPNENSVLRPDGTEVPVEILAQMVTIKGRQVLQGVFRDISERKNTETKLEESLKRVEEEKAKTQSIIAAIGDAISIQDTDFKVLYQNKIHQDILGDQKGRYCFMEYEHKDRICEGCPVNMTFMDGKIHAEERRIIRNKKELCFEITASPLRDSTGNIIAGIEVARNITERKKAEEELLKFKLGIERSDEAIFITNIDGSIIYLNPAFEKTYGYRREEVLGKTPRIIKSGMLPSEAYKPFWDTLLSNKVVNGELVNKTKDGHLLNIGGSANPILNDDGNIIGFLAIQRDITGVKHAEELLRKNMSMLEKAQELGQMGSWEWDIATNELIWSDEVYKLYGLDPAKDYPKYDVVVNTMTPETRDWFLKAIDDTLNHGKPFDGEYGLFRPDGTIRYTHTRGEVLRDREGNPVRMFGMVQDITERKLAEKQIISSLKEKEVLLRELHHRVKNNMQIVSSLLWLQSEYIKDKKDLEIFKDSQNRIMSMSLVHERLYRSRDLAVIDINEYITDLTNNLFRSYGVKAGTIALNISAGNVSLGIDSAIPCGLIINELVTNSLKYAFPDSRKGEISIFLHPLDENMVELAVSDNGVGIPDDVDFRKTESMGLRLVTILTENQLHGEIILYRSGGTEFRIKFKGAK